ncbi:cystathionine beta-synthase [candidate division GN15 bacterium]|uniref:Cystathionine beta-synthase n=1 Tax=candidate division GN15 bacterium TaxID=2072418 RepID=A0A855X8I9_9BACT|nr:MAG: cystathionine beta-synthase [candidate division GN15 bacterium]
MHVHESILELVGNTPLVRLRTGIPENGPQAFVKLEYVNPTGSVKDRMTLHIIRKAINEGKVKRGDTVIDNTSGNTGSALAMVASMYGLKAILVAPDKTSQEKIDLIKSFGAEVIITPTEATHFDPRGCYMVARTMAKKHGYFDLDQYDSQENVRAHYLSTGPEIWNDTDGKVTHFVAGIGTGGTFSGAARFLKEKNPKVRCIAVDPEGSIFADYIRDRKEVEGYTYKVEGIGSDVITKALHPDVVDEVITVSDADSFNRARLIARTEGISGGGSSGSVAVAMERVAKGLGSDAVIVGMFADAGIRYLTKCYNDEWMRKHGFMPVEQR